MSRAIELVFTASNIGVLFGSQIFGWVGDRYGRKTSLIAATSVRRVHLLRGLLDQPDRNVLAAHVAGFGIGGVIPNIVAINAESAPRNLRATIAIIAAAWCPRRGARRFRRAAFIPQYGWPVLFHIGGVVPS